MEGRTYRLPEDLEGEHNVVPVGFEWWQQTLIDFWVPSLTTYTDLGELLVALDLGSTQDIAIFLTDRAGRIGWRASGAHDAASPVALERTLGPG